LRINDARVVKNDNHDQKQLLAFICNGKEDVLQQLLDLLDAMKIDVK
jgi:hypothetical protein